MNNRSTSLDDIVVELSADLEAATKAQTESVLQSKRSGHGLAAVRRYIEAAFTPVRKHHAPPQILCDTDVAPKRKPAPPKVEKSLAEKTEIIFKDCEHTHRTPVRRAGLHRSHYIMIPRESADELIAEAVKSLSRKEDKDGKPNRKSSS